MKKQSEELRALRKALAAKERELANQRWIFEQFLNSPTWRWTAPVRWLANQIRGPRSGPGSGPGNGSAPEEEPVVLEDRAEGLTAPTADSGEKEAFAALCRATLDSLLATDAVLELPQSGNPTISIVLVLYNRAELTLACLRSIAEQRGVELEVVLVDNASSDETSRMLDRLRGPQVLLNPENRHFVRAVNQAARECRGEYLLLLNNDAQLLPGALESALRTIRSAPDIGAVGGRIMLLDGTLQEAGSIVWNDGSCLGYGRGDKPFAPMYSFRRDVDYCSGAFLLTPRNVWERLNGFDEAFAPAYYEETDYCMRLWEDGLRVVYEPGASIAHYEFASSAISAATALQARHQKLFAERHRNALSLREAPCLDRAIYARARHAGPRTLFLDDRIPHLWLGSGFPRAHALLRALMQNGHFVTLYPLTITDEPWDLAYSDLPREIEVMKGFGRDMLEAFLRHRRNYYSSIIISRPHNMELLAPILTSHKDWFRDVDVVYDAEALFALRLISLRRLEGTPMTEEETQSALAAETSLTAAANRILCVSEGERNAFLSQGIVDVKVLGHSLEAVPTTTTFAQRDGLLFVGAVHDETNPNADSLIWFLSEVLPLIRAAIPEIHLTIAGLNRSIRVRELADGFDGAVELTGHLPSLEALYERARLFVAPTRYAAGIPHKVHEAAARGLPVAATSILAEQLGWTDSELAIADDGAGFAGRCIEVYNRPERWQGLRDAALRRVQAECSPQAFERKVGEVLRSTATARTRTGTLK